MKVITFLEKTRELFPNSKFWIKGTYERGTRHCILGAMNVVGSSTRTKTGKKAAECEVSKTITELYGDRTRVGSHPNIIADFNDAKKTKFHDVIRVLDETIKRLQYGVDLKGAASMWKELRQRTTLPKKKITKAAVKATVKA